MDASFRDAEASSRSAALHGGGEGNPLGARAMYLHNGSGRDSIFRIHGTNEEATIGEAVSSGCIRMMNADVTDLYSRVKVGTRVVVIKDTGRQHRGVGMGASRSSD